MYRRAAPSVWHWSSRLETNRMPSHDGDQTIMSHIGPARIRALIIVISRAAILLLGTTIAMAACAAQESRLEPTALQAPLASNRRPQPIPTSRPLRTAQGNATVGAVRTPTPPETPTIPSPTRCRAEHERLPDGLVPEGRRLMWSDCRGIWSLGSVGPALRVSEVSDAQLLKIAPLGDRFVFGTGAGLEIASIEGGASRMLLDSRSLEDLAPSDPPMPGQDDGEPVQFPPQNVIRQLDWLSDNSALALSTLRRSKPREGMNMAVPAEDLWILPLDVGAPRLVLPPGRGGLFAFSPDAKRVVVASVSDGSGQRFSKIAVAMADGSGWREVIRHQAVSSESEWTPYPLPKWTDSGEALLLVDPQEPNVGDTDAGPFGLAYFDSLMRLLRIGLDGEVQLAIDAGRSSITQSQGYNALWSPDGRWVAYLERASDPRPTSPSPSTAGAYPEPAGPRTVPASTSGSELILASTEGSSQRRQGPAESLFHFAWSPDSRRYAFWEAAHRIRIGGVDHEPISFASDETWARLEWLSHRALILETGSGIEVWSLSEDLAAIETYTLLRGSNATGISISDWTDSDE
jgi:hypothetical protein